MKELARLPPTEFAVTVSIDEKIRQEESKSGIAHRTIAMLFLLWAYGGVLAATLVVIFFQGFKFYGFSLPPNFLNWLGGATIGEIGGLAAIVYGALFKRSR